MASKKAKEGPHTDSLQVFTDDGHVRPLIDIERELVRLSVAKNHGNMTKAAAELGIGRSTLYRYTENQIVGASARRRRAQGGKHA